jgi:hypothetical protein
VKVSNRRLFEKHFKVTFPVVKTKRSRLHLATPFRSAPLAKNFLILTKQVQGDADRERGRIARRAVHSRHDRIAGTRP